MRARMISGLAGPEGVAPPGSVIEGPTARIEALIEAGYAEPFVANPKREEAVACTLGAETATAPDGKRNGKKGAPPSST